MASPRAEAFLDEVAGSQRGLWFGYVFALAVFCAVAYRVSGAMPGGIGLPVWEKSQVVVYAAGWIAAAGALGLRHSIYAKADETRAAILRLAASEGLEAATEAVLPGALVELAKRELSVWTLACGPALVALPSVFFSGDVAPMLPMVALAFVTCALTFPRTRRYAEDAGAVGVFASGRHEEA